MPLKLETAIAHMPELAARLESLSNDGDDRQVPAFRNRFFIDCPELTTANC